jgi:hypothetical protein
VAVAYFRSDTLTGIRTPLCWTQLGMGRMGQTHASEVHGQHVAPSTSSASLAATESTNRPLTWLAQRDATQLQLTRTSTDMLLKLFGRHSNLFRGDGQAAADARLYEASSKARRISLEGQGGLLQYLP